MVNFTRVLKANRFLLIIAAMALFSLFVVPSAYAAFQSSVTRSWSEANLSGKRHEVNHPAANTYNSKASSSTIDGEERDLTATIKMANRLCFGACWWNDIGSKSTGVDHDSSVTTSKLQKYLEQCRTYKFYSQHRNSSGDGSNAWYSIDEPNVSSFQAGCAANEEVDTTPGPGDEIPDEIPH